MQGPQLASHRISPSVRLHKFQSATAKPESDESPSREDSHELREWPKSNRDLEQSDSGRGGPARWKAFKAKLIRHAA